MKRVQRVMFAVSLTAIWCLLMPPYLYGVIGIFCGFFYVGMQQESICLSIEAS